MAYLIIMADLDDILKTPDVSVAMALKIIMMTAFKIIIWSAVLLLALSIPDYFFQKREFIESLKMTKEEMKEELKETIGDPYITGAAPGDAAGESVEEHDEQGGARRPTWW